MTTSYSKIRAQIQRLEEQANSIKQEVVKRIRREIELHELTSEDLFGATRVGRKVRRTSAKSAQPNAGRAPKFGDAEGNSWGGMGKRPQWLRDALAAGASLNDFLLSARDKGGRAANKNGASTSPRNSKASVKQSRTLAKSAKLVASRKSKSMTRSKKARPAPSQAA